ncbi:hypothetical protein HZ993_15220 [Rhodoferax sp. AJA081-3]|uniref:hypothetical protein n=1 Tax=Rhodoferax sp. AJA081-3 TaxID=2752316 RepID=UPI001ADF84FC|nr:hypothetical protein [Rhodoferax sp. AJA081-3]QTN26663.1 hypothetical protein HZ993_15220 [Rhodoferax sp. AJA081-3]
MLAHMTKLSKRFALLACILATHAFAQTPDEVADAQARYKREVAACAPLSAGAGSSTCMREARNALAEVRRGKMQESWRTADFMNHALARCAVHTGDDKSDCIARIRGYGKQSGSVSAGGILRELTTTKSVPVNSPTVSKPEAAYVPDPNPPSGLMSNCRWVPPTDWVCK